MTRSITAAVLLFATTVLAAPSLFTSKVPYEPFVAKLEASGGETSRIIRVRSSRDLLRLESGKRYKFVVDETGTLSVAPVPADAPNNEYVHPILAGGKPVRTAGGIAIVSGDGKIAKVVLDQDSRSYCPTLQSLDEAARALERLGVLTQAIVRQDRPPQCAAMH